MRIFWCILFSCFALTFESPLAQPRLESEFKLDVPPAQVETLWHFMVDTFATHSLAKYDTTLTYTISEEWFVDRYFDTPQEALAFRQMGLRHRRRYVADTLTKELVQLKLPSDDSTGVARAEWKFDIYRKVKKSDRRALHPLWRLIRPAERDELSRQLTYYGINADELQPALTLNQRRRRVYIQKAGEPLITLTLDEVKHLGLPPKSFSELELELNELRYTAASPAERQLMEKLNQEFKEEIKERFPAIRQDQRPKYNKLRDLLEENPWSVGLVYYWPYLALLLLLLFAGWVLKKYR